MKNIGLLLVLLSIVSCGEKEVKIDNSENLNTVKKTVIDNPELNEELLSIIYDDDLEK